MKVSEIFLSIEGEGIRAGYPAVFIRLFGCNLRCSYCDSMYSVTGDDYKDMPIGAILSEVDKYNVPRVTLTGGEPLIHRDAAELLAALTEKYEVNIETNGSVKIGPILERGLNNDKIIFTMDWKSISSKCSDRMDVSNLHLLRDQDVLKFVVGSREDLDQMKSIIQEHSPACSIFVSPVFGNIEPAEIVDYILENHLSNCRMQLQLHKYIWDPAQRGV